MGVEWGVWKMTVGETNQSRSAADLIKRDDAPEPCPFCGNGYVTTEFDREQGDKWGYARCNVCAARGPEVRTNWDPEPDAPWHSEAIAAWNTRALPAIDPAAIREAALRKAYEVVYNWWFGDGNALPQELILALIGEKK